MGFELFAALRYLRHAPVRTALLLVPIVVGSAALVIALALMTGFHQDIRSRILEGTAHLTVTHRFDLTFEGADDLRSRLERRDRVRAAATVLRSPAMLAGSEFNTPAYAEVLGVDPSGYARVVAEAEQAPQVFGVLERPTGSGRAGVLLGATLARRLGVVEGDEVTLIVPQLRLTPFGPVPRTHVLEVAGTFEAEFLQEDGRRAYLTLPALRRVLRAEDTASFIEVRLGDADRVPEERDALREQLGGGWMVIDWLEANADWLKALNLEKLILFLAIGLILIVASMNILTSLMLMVAGKVREIGILSAMGASPGQIARIFVWVGAVLGVGGAIVGVALGTLLARLADSGRWIRLDPEVYYLTHVPFSPSFVDVAGVAVIAVAISLLATLPPARRAALLRPVEALRHE